MDILSSRQNQILLFDFYGEMLTPRQQEVFTMSTMDDYSFTEIAHKLGITPQGVVHFSKRSKERLRQFEETFGLLTNHIIQKEVVAEIGAELEKLDNLNVTEISEISGAIKASLEKLV